MNVRQVQDHCRAGMRHLGPNCSGRYAQVTYARGHRGGFRGDERMVVTRRTCVKIQDDNYNAGILWF